jgi:hypothetical protein
MVNPWFITGSLLAAVGLFIAGDYHGRGVKDTEWQARTQTAVNEAITQARITEREQQEAVTDAIQRQYWEQVAISSDLAADIERLRNRPSRPAGVPQAAGSACQGANGAELAREYAELLTRRAARAAEQDAALEACQRYADAVIAPWKSRTSN